MKPEKLLKNATEERNEEVKKVLIYKLDAFALAARRGKKGKLDARMCKVTQMSVDALTAHN